MSSEWRKQTKARKSHQCEICRETIYPGEIYVRYDCTPWGHPDNEGYHTYRCCRFCDHMHYDVLDIADVDGYSYWEETVQEIRGHFYYLVSVSGILHPETDLETYADDFSRWTLAGGPFERCAGHPDKPLDVIQDWGTVRCENSGVVTSADKASAAKNALDKQLERSETVSNTPKCDAALGYHEAVLARPLCENCNWPAECLRCGYLYCRDCRDLQTGDYCECCDCEPRRRPCYECGMMTNGGKYCSRSCWISAIGAGDEETLKDQP